MRKRRLPAGTSEYQAAWILDDDEDGSNDGSEGSDDEFDGELSWFGSLMLLCLRG